MTYTFWHTPKLRSIRNGGYERHGISLEIAETEFAEWLRVDLESGDFVAREIETPERLRGVIVRRVAILHKRTNRLWYVLQITATN